ncbi:trafficking protein particle complex subunit 9-like isoform X1 [Centruroides sculpturatus]|uniref:trafficking protein particle complex subunit 9-like isoform X1 n=1 Tax=Centruroides sculpturatus TaxID=218467 RepID=UPI000C6DE9E2|nr:trafficking protein particle complex subunit 9-like isoform X1 [Centruroides sculpturatus]XP_023236925.1 trafficking protein particle complex subunit 9-like isoform X1 [Centruroides sculpturatus]
MITYPDYSQRPEDHQALLILVKQIGPEIKQKTFNKIFEQISRVQYLKIQDPNQSNNHRGIWLRYKKSYPTENNEWGDFQAHRKVLGLLSLGKCVNSSEIEELHRQHNLIQEKYSSTLFDSRCLIFGVNPNSQTSNNLVKDKSECNNTSKQLTNDCTDVPDLEKCSNSVGKSKCVNDLELNRTKKESNKNVSDDEREKNEISSADSLHVQSENKTSPMGYLNLMIPLTVKSRSTHCILYSGIDDCDQLEQDLMEFGSSLFWVLESKRLDRSFEKQDKVILLTAPFEKKDFVGLDTDSRVYKKRCIGRMKKYIGDLSLQAGMPVEALVHYSSAIDNLRSINDWLWLASAYEGQCAASIILQYPPQFSPALHRNSSFPVGNSGNIKIRSVSHSRSLPNSVDSSDFKNFGKNVLSPEEILEKYKEVISHYNKFHNAAVIELECNLKAARVLILQEKYLQASEFVHNALNINLQQSEDDKINQFVTLAQLYEEIGFHRKSAFFKRMAALQCVSPQNSKCNWNKCYHHLLQTLDGYKLTLDPKDVPRDIMNGWPCLQIQTLYELVTTATRMGNQPLAVRHMTFLLHVLLDYLTPAEKEEYCLQLESLTSNCEGCPKPLALDSGVIIPPVNLLTFPQVRSFKLQNLAPHLRPVKVNFKQTTEQCGPFIFCPIQLNKKPRGNTNKIDFKWVEDDVCEVALQVFNLLPFELKVTNMGLLTEGIPFESFPACLSLPAHSGPYPVNLFGTPRGRGELRILGYTTQVLGVKSNCKLRDLNGIKRPFYCIDIIPALPQLQVTTSLPKASTFSSLANSSAVVMSAAVTIFAGESRECTITLTNTGKEMVERIDISVQVKSDKSKESSFFTWSQENLAMQLPITPGSSACFTLYINGLGEFVYPTHKKPIERIGTPSKNTPVHISSVDLYPPKSVEAILQIQYSGGPGMREEYCRHCSVAITVEILPSLVISKWDVLPADMPSQCYLVLDILNASNYEMELQYSTNKKILIEAKDTCRIPVAVERCPPVAFHQDGDGNETTIQSLCHQHLVNLVDLNWTLPTIGISGRASIVDVTWTESMMDVIMISPIHWEMMLNGHEFKVEEEFNFIVGELVVLNITIHNISDAILESVQLCIQGYQDHQNGHYNYRLENKRAIIGSDKVLIPKVLPHDHYRHECGLVFFHTGVYKFDVQCSSYVLNKLNTNRKSIKNLHTWKCTPSIELTVVD